MKIDIKLINKKVILKPLDVEGRIQEISIVRAGTKFLIRYWYNGQMKEDYCYEDEFELKN